MQINNTDRALQVWNCQNCHKAKSATFVKHDGLYVVKDGRGRVLGGVTPGGDVLIHNDLLTFRVLAHG
jgi:hypothetical protein